MNESIEFICLFAQNLTRIIHQTHTDATHIYYVFGIFKGEHSRFFFASMRENRKRKTTKH